MTNRARQDLGVTHDESWQPVCTHERGEDTRQPMARTSRRYHLPYKWNRIGISDSFARLISQRWIYSSVAAVLLFSINVELVWPTFVPNLSEITAFAEAAYINNGRMLAEGMMVPLGYSPLSAILYALIYIPFESTPYWLVYCCWVGRVLLFALLWASAYLVAEALAGKESDSNLVSPLLVVALAFVSPALINLITQAGHALFAAMSAFALSHLLLFCRSNQKKYLIAASFFVAASVLARSGEGLILWISLIGLATWLRGRLNLTQSLAGSILPCAAILVAYMLLYSSVTGQFDLGMAEYSYFAFEQGQGLAHQSHYPVSANFYVDGQLEARRLFGTPEENGYSIFAAIMRNPIAYIERVPQLIKLVPMNAIAMYGGGLGLAFFFFAVRGVIELARQNHYRSLAILLLWSSYLALYPFLVFQPMHFLFPYYVILVLTAVGLTATIRNSDGRTERCLWYVTFAATLAAGVALGHARLVSIFLFLLLGIALLWMVMRRYREVKSIEFVGLFLLLIGLVLHNKVPEHKFATLGIAAEDQATLFLRDHLKAGTPVAAYAPKNIWMAKLTYIPMFRSASELNEQNFRNWIESNHVRAIYVDPNLKVLEPSFWALVQAHKGRDLSLAFSADGGKYQVLYSNYKHPGEVLEGYIERPWYSSKPRFISN